MAEMAQYQRDSRAPDRRRLRGRGGIAFKLTLASGALLLCWRVAAARFAEFDSDAFWGHLASIPSGAIALALLAAALSYAAISCYDLIAFRVLGITAPPGKILRSGAAATALGQLFGFGLIIGAFARWRLLRRDGVTQTVAAAASAIVTAGFLGGLVVLGGLTALAWPNDIAAMTGAPGPAVRIGGFLILTLFAAVLIAGHLRFSTWLSGHKIAAPRPLMTFAQVALAAFDVLFAAAVLWLLTPAAAGVDFGTMFLAYIGVLAICLLANTPGGVGPLEGALLFALPDAPTEALLAGIIAFRVVYYAVPGLLGLIVLIDTESGGHIASLMKRRPSERDPALAGAMIPPSITSGDPALRRALARSGRAEDELAHLGDKCFFASRTANAFLMYRRRGRALVAIGDPIGDPQETQELCTQFLLHAHKQGLTPVFYKAGRSIAYAARMAGLRVDRFGREAVIDLATFTIADRDRREIRRKVRKVAKSGVTIIYHAPGAAPLSSYKQICTDWQAMCRASEASFSMGRCDERYLSRFPIFEARIGDSPVAFISIWRSGDGREWSLDVMRHSSGAPPGVMHALIVAACDSARAAGAIEFNLCLAPLSGLSLPLSFSERAGDWAYRRGERLHRLQGLHRFKASFRPSWRPRYVARARGVAGLYGLWAVYRLIHPGRPQAPAQTDRLHIHKLRTPIESQGVPPSGASISQIAAVAVEPEPQARTAEQHPRQAAHH